MGVLPIERGDVQIGVQDLDLGIGLEVPGDDVFLPPHIHPEELGLVAVQLERQFLEVEDDLGHVLDDPGDGRELVQDVLDLDRGDGRARNRGQQDPTQGVPQGDPEPPLERLHDKLPVGIGEFRELDLGLRGIPHLSQPPVWHAQPRCPHQHVRLHGYVTSGYLE